MSHTTSRQSLELFEKYTKRDKKWWYYFTIILNCVVAQALNSTKSSIWKAAKSEISECNKSCM
jgi:hypothetical protein